MSKDVLIHSTSMTTSSILTLVKDQTYNVTLYWYVCGIPASLLNLKLRDFSFTSHRTRDGYVAFSKKRGLESDIRRISYQPTDCGETLRRRNEVTDPLMTDTTVRIML